MTSIERTKKRLLCGFPVLCLRGLKKKIETKEKETYKSSKSHARFLSPTKCLIEQIGREQVIERVFLYWPPNTSLAKIHSLLINNKLNWVLSFSRRYPPIWNTYKRNHFPLFQNDFFDVRVLRSLSHVYSTPSLSMHCSLSCTKSKVKLLLARSQERIFFNGSNWDAFFSNATLSFLLQLLPNIGICHSLAMPSFFLSTATKFCGSIYWTSKPVTAWEKIISNFLLSKGSINVAGSS